jgi:hypothetical protein
MNKKAAAIGSLVHWFIGSLVRLNAGLRDLVLAVWWV